MMEDLVEGAKEELKRADHSLYVTLKYTRTVDVIKNIIKRLISAYDIAMLDALQHLHTKKKIKEMPPVSKKRALVLASSFHVLKKDIDFYFMLRDIDVAEYTKREEYRKNVALITTLKGKQLIVDIETIRRYFDKTVEFVDKVHELVIK
ncbi:MAG: hypothetical protein AABX72_05110 [Nanoarchaeota archaeon]